jgi:hypothetical protein
MTDCQAMLTDELWERVALLLPQVPHAPKEDGREPAIGNVRRHCLGIAQWRALA